MREYLKSVVRSAIAPVLRWFEARLEAIDGRLADLHDGQEELARVGRSVLDAHDDGLEVIGRELARQRVVLESLELRQAELLAEVRAASTGAPVPMSAPVD